MKPIRDISSDTRASDLKIHRIVGVERLLQLLHEKSLALVAPEKWQDPYEQAIQKHSETFGGALGEFKVFGLCWSLEARSDALWQIYSPNKLGIKISTTVGRLAACIVKSHTSQSILDSIFIGRVAYLPERTSKKTPYKWPLGSLRLSQQDFSRSISTFAAAIDEIVAFSPGQMPRDAGKLARSFLVKRRAFRHEEELRILCFPTTESRKHIQTPRDEDNKVIKLPISLCDLITQIEFDPRMGDDVADALTSFVGQSLRHLQPRKQIKKSSLYSIPPSKGFSQ